MEKRRRGNKTYKRAMILQELKERFNGEWNGLMELAFVAKTGLMRRQQLLVDGTLGKDFYVSVSVETQLKALQEFCSYIHPKLSAISLDGADGDDSSQPTKIEVVVKDAFLKSRARQPIPIN